MVSTATPALPHVQSSIRSFFQPCSPRPPSTADLRASTRQSPLDSNLSAKISSEQSKQKQDLKSIITLPPQASITPIEPHHIQPLRRINSLLLPISYPDSFYTRILEPHLSLNIPISFSRVIIWKEGNAEPKVIGGMVCRVDPNVASPSTFDLYIQSLALLSPYRSKGLVTAMLEDILHAIKEHQKNVSIASLYAHVWTENQEALTWYGGRDFIKEGGMINGYYRRLKPDTAWILRRMILPSDLVPRQGTLPPQTSLPNARSASSIPTSTKPPAMAHTSSFQDRRPDKEWNDLPEDILGESGLVKPPAGRTSVSGSRASSQSSSRSEGREKVAKKKRLYPAAAFGEISTGR